MPKWFEEYLRELPDYKIDELLKWADKDMSELYEVAEEFVGKLQEINS